METDKTFAGEHVAIVVLGDVGRSPRMQYHTLSLLNHGASVSLVGYHGEALIPQLVGHPRLSPILFEPFEWDGLKRRIWLLFACVKAIALTLQLFFALLRLPSHTALMVVQNPPALPLLPVVWAVCQFRRLKLVIDWHNLGFTVLALALRKPSTSPFVWAFRFAERVCAQGADGHLCVTHAMRDFLIRDFGLSASVTVLHDQPPSFFGASDIATRHHLFQRLDSAFAEAAAQLNVPTGSRIAPLSPVSRIGSDSSEPDDADSTSGGDDQTGTTTTTPTTAAARDDKSVVGTGLTRTLFTEQLPDGTYRLRPDRPPLIISSTSWTLDEDFGILLDALLAIDTRPRAGATGKEKTMKLDFPFTVVVVTGKGPMKRMYQEKIKALALKRFCVLTLWLEPGDYPVLLASADLGVCLHTSTSGLDLPMKVVDMFGCGVPVLAMDFSCLDELVTPGRNGLVFTDSTTLVVQLRKLFASFPGNATLLDGLRKGAQATVRWEQEWNCCALPLIAAVRTGAVSRSTRAALLVWGIAPVCVLFLCVFIVSYL